MEKRKFDAVILANTISYAAPSFGGDKASFTKKQQSWDNFMDSLTWKEKGKDDKIEKAGKGLLSMFGMMGALIKDKKGDIVDS